MPTTSASALTIQTETNAMTNPTSATAAQAMLDLRVKNGVKRTATIVPISHISAVKGRSPTPPPDQPGMKGFSMLLTHSGNSDMNDSAPLKGRGRLAFG